MQLLEKMLEATEGEYIKLIKDTTRKELVDAVNESDIMMNITSKMNKNDIATAVINILMDGEAAKKEEQDKGPKDEHESKVIGSIYPASDEGQDTTEEKDMPVEDVPATEQEMWEAHIKEQNAICEEMTVEKINPNERVQTHQLNLLAEKYNQVPTYINPYLSAISISQLGVIAVSGGNLVFIPGATVSKNGKGSVIGRM